MAANHLKKCYNQPKDSVGGGEGCLRRNANKGNGKEGGRQAMVMRAMATATTMAATWVMAMALRLVGDKEGKGKGGIGNGNGNLSGGQ